MARTVAIGIQNFETIVTNDYFYVDKTDFFFFFERMEAV